MSETISRRAFIKGLIAGTGSALVPPVVEGLLNLTNTAKAQEQVPTLVAVDATDERLFTASPSSEAFLKEYKPKAFDVVTLIPQGGNPENVADYWRLNIQRGPYEMSNLPIAESKYGGHSWPLGITSSEFDNGAISYIMEGVFLGFGEEETIFFNGKDEVFQPIIFAVPRSDGKETLTMAVYLGKNLPIGIGYQKGSERARYPFEDVIKGNMMKFIRAGDQMRVNLGGFNSKEEIEAANGIADCNTDARCQMILAYNQPPFGTDPNEVYKWANGLIPLSDLPLENGVLPMFGGIADITAFPPAGRVY